MNKLTYVSPEVKYALVENDILTAAGSPEIGGEDELDPITPEQ